MGSFITCDNVFVVICSNIGIIFLLLLGMSDAMTRFGLIGTITYDVITGEGENIHEGLGGILYQVAVLCGLGYEVNLYTNLGGELETEVQELTKEWRTLNPGGINTVSGPGNRVFLDYPTGRERIEVLKSVVPPINPDRILGDLSA
jgi:hypothetical protein